MSTLFGCHISDPRYLAHGLYSYRDILQVSETFSPYGWGLSYHQDQDVLSKHRPRFMGGLDFYKIVEQLPTKALLGVVRSLGQGRTVPENTQPFRLHGWCAGHKGQIARFGKVRDWLRGNLPDFVRRNIKGETDSEHLFHLLLSYLYDQGLLDDHTLPAESLALAMRTTFEKVEEYVADAGGGESQLNMLVTNGRVMVAAAHSIPVYTLRLQGLEDCALCRVPPETWNGDPTTRDHPDLEMVLILAEPPDDADLGGLTIVEPGNIVLVEQDYQLSVMPLAG